MRRLGTMTTLTFILTLVVPSAALGQSCSVIFETATVKPSVWGSLMTVLKSFNPKGEAQRLSALRQQVQQLKEDKHQLSDTLNTVLQQNSVPSWLEARVKQIPDIQNKVVIWTTYDQKLIKAASLQVTNRLPTSRDLLIKKGAT